MIRPRRIRAIAGLADTIVFYYDRHEPKTSPWLKRKYFKALTRHTLRRADLITTLSRSSRDELCGIVSDASTRIRVVSPGPGIRHSSGGSTNERVGVLLLGSALPHKAIREALLELAAYIGARSNPLPVTVTGLKEWPAAWGNPPAMDISYVGRLPEPDLQSAFAGHRALVLPSHIEGFGLPALEAYAAGTPVCYRNTSALAEILDGTPGAWDGSSDGFGSAMDATLAMTPHDVARISERLAGLYSWERAAGDMVEIYRQQLQAGAMA